MFSGNRIKNRGKKNMRVIDAKIKGKRQPPPKRSHRLREAPIRVQNLCLPISSCISAKNVAYGPRAGTPLRSACVVIVY